MSEHQECSETPETTPVTPNEEVVNTTLFTPVVPPESPVEKKKSKKWRIFLIVLCVMVFLYFVMIIWGGIVSKRNRVSWSDYLNEQKLDSSALVKIEKENKAIQKKMSKLAPKGVYLLIDTASNILYIKKGSETIKQVVVSCGSGNILQEPSGKRTWVFDTPRGEFKVQSKLKKPVWVKPDWAFIEEGKAIPDDEEERLEPGVMGDYAMGFGDGYFVHGTLYTRLLGRNVTHGCVRVGDEDLKAIFKAVSLGTTLYIF